MKVMKNNLAYPLAILDVGSNSVRLMKVDENGNRNKVTVSTRLGEGLSFSKYLKQEAIMRTVDACVRLYYEGVKFGAKQIYIFATAAVRNSLNGKDFVNEIKRALNLDVDVVSGDLEGKLALDGALMGSNGGVIDVGGASSEVCYKNDGQISYSYSLEMGAVKLFDACGRDYQKIKELLNSLVCKYGDIPKGNYTAVGGTATSLGAISLGLTEYDPNVVHGHYISRLKLEQITTELFSLTPSEICNRYCVGKKRADIIAGGSAIMLSILQYANLDGVTISENDNLEGYLLYLGGKI